MLSRLVFVVAAGAALVLAPTTAARAQRACAEAFDTVGVKRSGPAAENLFLIIKAHKKGDFTDATRIHMMLAQYHAAQGDTVRANESKRRAAEAWNAGEAGAKLGPADDPKACVTPGAKQGP